MMKSFATKLFFACLTVSCAASAQTYRIQDSGVTRTFVIEEEPASVSVKSAPAEEQPIILYEQGVRKTEYTKRTVTTQVLVELEPGTDPAALAKKHGAGYATSPVYAPGFHILETETSFGALSLAEALRSNPAVLSAEPLLTRLQQKKSIPNDPQFTNQWHLLNTGQNGGTPGIDVNVTNVWETYQGNGIIIGIIDDGLLETHEDLSANANTALSYDFWEKDNNPAPGTGDDHGTPCAGIIAAEADNSTGVSGVAPQSELAGLRLIVGATSDSQEANALSYSNQVIDIKSNSWGPDDDGMTLAGPGTLTATALKTGAENNNTLFFWAGGNGLNAGDNANYDGYANSIYTIAVGAVDLNGVQSWYSEPGACLIVCAPSSGDSIGITTTAYDGGYENDFGGTSAATPLAAGVAALILEANPNLGWRDIQEILMQSALKNFPTDNGWTDNAAGFHFNHKYGAGMVNAESAVALCLNWHNLGTQTNLSIAKTGLNQPIPDDYGGVAGQTFTVTNNFRVEHVTVETEITHTFRSDIEIWLISPAGTESLLAWRSFDEADDLDWTFSSVRNWGESSAGDWSVEVYDNYAEDTGTVNSLTLTLYGTYDADTDGDGLQNLDETGTYGSNPYLTDTDSDGMDDGDETLAGTQLTNAASALIIESLNPSDSQIGWQSVAGKKYTLQYTTNLFDGFQTLETNITATPPQNVFTNLPTDSRGYFRILLD